MTRMNDDELTEKLRARCCELGSGDHGHTDCWLYGLAADRIEKLEAEKTYEARAATVEDCNDPWDCCIHNPDMGTR